MAPSGRNQRLDRVKTEGSVLILVLAGFVVGAWHGAFTDLLVYQYGGRAVLQGEPIYAARDPVTGLRFTYPPFAAIVLAPLALLPSWLVAGVWTGASTGALAAVVGIVRRHLRRPTQSWVLAALTVGFLAFEPVWQTLVFGQINLLLMLAVLLDLTGRQRWWGGVVIGLVAGIKLTPLGFVALLVLIGRPAAAARALLAFVATIVLGFVATPSSAAAYWQSDVVDAGRVGPPALAHNQSVYGALTRLVAGAPPTLLWLGIAVPVISAFLLLGASCWRRGNQLLGIGLAAIGLLFGSPVSWTHHWVWAVPVALALWEVRRWLAVGWATVFVARPVTWPPWGQGREFGWTPLQHIVGNAYLLAGLALAVVVVALSRRTRSRAARRPEPVSRSGSDHVSGGQAPE